MTKQEALRIAADLLWQNIEALSRDGDPSEMASVLEQQETAVAIIEEMASAS